MKNLRFSKVDVICKRCGSGEITTLGKLVRKEKIECTNCNQLISLNLNSHSNTMPFIEKISLTDMEKSFRLRLN